MTLSRRSARIGLATLALGLGAAACQVVAGLDGDFTQAPMPIPTADAGADAADGGSTGCASATYPDPPAGKDDGVTGDIVVALRSIALGEGSPMPPGYDLDHVCTCFEDAGPSCVSQQQHCDAPGGVDSASAQIFSLIQFAAGATNFGSSAFSARAEQGYFSILLRVRGYNGKADDPVVDVALYPSPGIVQKPPHWDGNDTWQVPADSIDDGDLDSPIYTSAGAYVAHGTLVAALPTILMNMGGDYDSITLRLTDGVVTGALVQQGGQWALTGGIIAARWAVPDIFAALSSFRDQNQMPICTDQTLSYNGAKSAICNGLDILADSSGAATLPCNAISIGFGFTAQAAQLGAVVTPPTPSPGCPAATDPANDSCK